MSGDQAPAPPRPIEAGDVVTAYCDDLGEWTAAQVTRIDVARRKVGVLDLDWSGPKPSSVHDLGPLRPLRPTHHSWDGHPSHCNYDWVLPRSCHVIGRAPLVVDNRSNRYSSGWDWGLGEQLSWQRRWEANHGDEVDASRRVLTGETFTAVSAPDHRVRALTITSIVDLDCSNIPRLFPNVTTLRLSGDLGTLGYAQAISELPQLRCLYLNNLFGMTSADCPDPDRLTRMDALFVHSVPSVFASAVRKRWRPEIERGTNLQISAPRTQSWLEENRDNPLRDWDGRGHISAGRFKKAVAQYRATRAAVLAALSDPTDPGQLAGIGRDFAGGFNKLDGTRSPFIETEEREELFAALTATVDFAESRLGQQFPHARGELISGLEDVRDW